MPRARIPAGEMQRLHSLRECGILDSSPEKTFDDLTALAARLCDTPIALVSLVDAERQWFMSAVGTEAKETHRDSAFCAHAILGHEPLIVTDAATDPRTFDNALVLGPPHIRFYAGIPLRTGDGHAVGTLCVIDTVPRDITGPQLADLESLARQVTSQLELHRLNRVLSQSQSQLQEMHTRLNEIATQVPGVVFQFELRPDGSSCFPYASEGIRKIYRVSPEEVRNDATAVFSVLHPDDYDGVVESIQASGRDLTPWRHEYRVRFADGQVRWLYGNSIPRQHADGSIQWHGFITDETEQRHAREEAMLMRARMHAVVQGSTQLSIIATDLEGIITVFNSGAERLLGYTAAEMIGLQTPQMIHLRSEVEARSHELSRKYGYPVQGFETFVHSARLGGHSESDWTYIRKDGSQLAVHLVVTATRGEDGKITGFVGVAANVTDARRTEESLRFERERLDLALAGGEIGTWDWNIQTGHEIWDTGFANLLGERLEDLNQTFNEFTARVHPQDLAVVRSIAQKHLDGLTPIYAAEFRIRQKNGEWRWVQARGRLMQRDQHGRPLRMLGTMADISDRKRTEEELVSARVMADTANRSKSEFLANMSHEIRTPLTSILGHAELFSEPGLSAFETAESIATIKSAGSHLMTIINDVLDLSKIEAGKMTIECIEISPSRIIHEVLSVLQPAAHAKGLKLSARCIGPTPNRIISDPVRLRQILMNLVGNSVKFTEDGRVSVTVQTVPASSDGIERLAFEVTDSGIGMTQEQCSSLFEPFTQADPSVTRRFGGTGLGLAICRRMARILNGEIVATSQPGIGSTFRVTIATGSLQNVEMLESLSIAEETSGRSPFALQHLKKSLQGRILLAEDNPVNRRLFEAILRNAGADVDLAENGQVAVEKAVTAMMPSSSPDNIAHSTKLPGYDVILMDMQMPVLDGYSATKHLRAIRYQGPIVALTAHALLEDRQKCLSIGCDDVITKPVERDVLIHTCHEWIERGRSNRCRVTDTDKSALTFTVPDPACLDLKALMDSVDSDLELLDDLIGLFISNSADLICELQQAIDARNCAAVGALAHSLKGAVSTFSARNALHAAMTVESLAKDADLDGATGAVDRLKSELDELIHELAELRTDHAKPMAGQFSNRK
jgi:PAS domain S-box-containing protein